jgi:hypothetical protein
MKPSSASPHFYNERPVLFLKQYVAEVIKATCRRKHTSERRRAQSCKLFTKTIRLAIRFSVKRRLIPLQPNNDHELLHAESTHRLPGVFDSFVADLKKEIRAEKTGLTAGNNFIIDHVAKGSAPVANRDPNAYLAINWQQPETEARITCRDRRFPTPHPQRRNNRANGCKLTTNHLVWPNEQRRAASLLPIWLPNPIVFALNCPRPLRSRARLPRLHQE